MLFDVQMPGSILGHLTDQAARASFPSGLPVICTTSDKPVEALGAGLLDDETAVISLGTYIALMMNGKAAERSRRLLADYVLHPRNAAVRGVRHS
jgi:sugar (pentulose or hexulose) kinase